MCKTFILMEKKTHKPRLVTSQSSGLEILLYDHAKCLYRLLKNKIKKILMHSQFLCLLLVNTFILTRRNPSSHRKAKKKHGSTDLHSECL